MKTTPLRILVLTAFCLSLAFACAGRLVRAEERTFQEWVAALESVDWLEREDAVDAIKRLAPDHLGDLAEAFATGTLETKWRLQGIVHSLPWTDAGFFKTLEETEDHAFVLPLVHYALGMDNPTTRRAIVKLLVRWNSVESVPRLREACSDRDMLVLEAVALAFGELDKAGAARGDLLRLLSHESEVAVAVMRSINKLDLRGPDVFREVFMLLDSTDSNLVGMAAQYVSLRQEPAYIPFYCQVLNEGGVASKRFACSILAGLRAPEAVGPLTDCMKNTGEIWSVREAAVSALKATGGDEAVRALVALYPVSERNLRVLVLDALQALDPEQARAFGAEESKRFESELAVLIDRLSSPQPAEADAARLKLASFGADAYPALRELIEESADSSLQWTARMIIAENQPFERMVLQLYENKIQMNQMQYMLNDKGNTYQLSQLQWIFNSGAGPHQVTVTWDKVGVGSKIAKYGSDLVSTIRSQTPSELLLLDFIASTHGLGMDFKDGAVQMRDAKRKEPSNAKETRDGFAALMKEEIDDVALAGLVGFSYSAEPEDLQTIVDCAARKTELTAWNEHVVLAVEKLARKESVDALKQLHAWMTTKGSGALGDAARRALIRVTEKDFPRDDARWLELFQEK